MARALVGRGAGGPNLAKIGCMETHATEQTTGSISHFIKEIGRGSDGARALDSAQAQQLMGAVLDRSASDLEIGAFAIAMRMKGETLEELDGFLAAARERCMRVASERPVVVLPSYNGARRLPNLAPLLALRLAQQGERVLMHGPLRDPRRVSSADVLQSLGVALARTQAEIEASWARCAPAFVPIDTLCPPLAWLLDVRWTIGVRSSGHTIVKMLNPVVGAASLRIGSYTHPEFGELLAAHARASAADLMLLRGTEGEAVADPRRQPRIDTFLHGVLRPELSCPAHDGPLAELPALPSCDAASTAQYIGAVLAGTRPSPAPLESQVRLARAAVQALATDTPTSPHRPAVSTAPQKTA